MKINRHKIPFSHIPDGTAVKKYEEIVELYARKIKLDEIEKIIKGKRHIDYTVIRYGFNVLRYYITSKQDHREIIEKYMNIIIDSYILQIDRFLIYAQKNNSVTPEKKKLNTFYWVQVFSLAIILGEKSLIKQMLNLAEKIKNQDIGKTAYNYFFRYLTVYFSEKKINLNVIFWIIEGLNIDMGGKQTYRTKKIKDFEILPDIELTRNIYPKSVLLNEIILNDSANFNDLLCQYLNETKNWIETNKLNILPRFWIDFELLAICSVACRNGIEIVTESEYIPKELFSRIE